MLRLLVLACLTASLVGCSAPVAPRAPAPFPTPAAPTAAEVARQEQAKRQLAEAQVRNFQIQMQELERSRAWKDRQGQIKKAEVVAAAPAPVAVQPAPVKSEWVKASGHLFPGVKLFQPSGYYAQVADVDPSHTEINYDGTIARFSGVLLRYPDGYEEWKDRSVPLRMFVRSDDPAIREFWDRATGRRR